MEKINNLVSEIIKDLTDEDKHISNILRKAFIIAETINNTEMMQWINLELEGYKEPEKTPDYRIFSSVVKGLFESATRSGEIIIPVSAFPKKFQKEIKFLKVRETIEFVEKKAKGSQDFLFYPIPQELTLELEVEKNYLRRAHFTSAWKEISKTAFAGLIDIVKTRLLKLFLSMRQTYPKFQINLIKKDTKKLTSIINQTIFNGNNNSAQNITNSKDISIVINDTEALISALKQFNLPNDIINELKNIKKDNPNFKDTITKWAYNLPSKLGDKMIDAFSFSALLKIVATFVCPK